LSILFNILFSLLKFFKVSLDVKGRNNLFSRHELLFRIIKVLILDFAEEKLSKKYTNFVSEDFRIVLRPINAKTDKMEAKVKSNVRKKRCAKRKRRVRNGKFKALKREYSILVTKQARLSRIASRHLPDELITDPKEFNSKKRVNAEVEKLIKKSDKVLERVLRMKNRRVERRAKGLDKSYLKRQEVRSQKRSVSSITHDLKTEEVIESKAIVSEIITEQVKIDLDAAVISSGGVLRVKEPWRKDIVPDWIVKRNQEFDDDDDDDDLW